MNLFLITQQGGFLKPFAWVMGEILNVIYKLCSLMGVANIALCIVIFTIVVKMLMLPLTVKQQKFSKVSAKMNPELQALQKKYAGADRTNQAVMMKMQQEQQEIYQKYGASPLGGCLPLLITLPIIFALYRVIYAIPAYVDDVNEQYKSVSNAIINEYGEEKDFNYKKALEEFCKANNIQIRTKASKAENDTDRVIDILSVFNTDGWKKLQKGEQILKKGEPDNDYKNWNAMVSKDSFKDVMNSQEKKIDQILKINVLFGKFNILDNPNLKSITLLIPILAALLQFLQGKISMAVNKTSDNSKKNDDPMNNSMKTMNTVMPIMSGFICFMLPVGVGLYWIANSGVTIVQQIAINKQLDKIDIDEMVEENAKKKQERYEKMGIVSTGNSTSDIAKSSTKSISTMKTSDIQSKKQPVISQDAREELSNTNKGSISSIANILKERNKDN